MLLVLLACRPDPAGGSGPGGDPDPGSGPGAPDSCDPGGVVAAKATFYESPGVVACSYRELPEDFLAFAPDEYQLSAACGTCVEVTGPRGTVTAVAIDLCPECRAQAIDLHAHTFAKIADPAVGIVDVAWRAVPCAVEGPLRYRILEASSRYWIGIVPTNQSHPIESVELRPAGAAEYLPLARDVANQFSASFDPPLPETFAIRARDVHGHVLVDEGIALVPGAVVSARGNFPETCP
jgi:expansin